MAEESVDPLITPEENEFVSKKKMVKTAVENPSSPSARGKKPDSANISLKMVPNYLRASTGSCHDLCKFGRKHAPDEMARKPLRLRTAKSVEIIVSDMQKPSADTKKHSLVLKPSISKERQNAASSRTKTRFPNSPTEKPSSSNPPEIIKREVLPPSRKVEVLVREGNYVSNKMSTTDKKAYDHFAKRSSSVMPKPVKLRTSSVSDNLDCVHGKGRRYSDVQTSRKVIASTMSAKKALMPIAAPSSPKFVRTKTILSKARKTGPKLKLLSPVKDASADTSNGEDCEKILHVLETVVENNAVESPSSPNYLSNPNSPSLFAREKDDEVIKYIENEVEDVFVAENIVQPLKESLKYSGNEVPDEFVADNIVSMSSEENNAMEAIIMTESLSLPKSPSLSSRVEEEEDDDDDQEEEDIGQSDSETDESFSNKTTPKEITKTETVKQNQKKNLRKKKMILSEDKHHSPIKLKFRSGITVDPQPENNTPRRLKFRRAIVNSRKPDDFVSDKNKSIEINNNTTKDAKLNQTKSFTRKSKVVVSEDKYRAPRSPVKLSKSQRRLDHQYSDINTPTRLRFSKARVQRAEDSKSDDLRKTLRKSGGKDDAGFSGLSSRKVVLKHQDLQGKKDDQGLLNNVIEETASKLVETRKSKVKALVGAFETVISLQERTPKPSLRII